jgi:hypothetical protein
MKDAKVSPRIGLARILSAAGLLASVSLVARPVLASLGEGESSIEADAAKAEAVVRPSTEENYTVYEFQTSSGILVREYAAPGGNVFAVTWRGPWMPDLRQLLGSYFEVFRRAERGHHARRRPFVVQEPDFVLHSSGRTRSFFGGAHVPSLVPAGVRVEALP